jgi:hypothetical protein
VRRFRRAYDPEIEKGIAEPIRRATPFLPNGVYPGVTCYLADRTQRQRKIDIKKFGWS